MNLEYFHTLLSRVRQDMESEDVPNLVATLATHLQSQVSAPAEASHQTNVSNVLKQLRKLLPNSPSNAYPPSWKEALNEFNLPYFVASQLLKELNNAFAGNEITPQIVLEAVQKINTEIEKDMASISPLLEGLVYLDVTTDDLPEGASEISVLIPREYTKNDPSLLGKELVAIQKLLNPFTEMATGKPQQIEIRSISSSEFLITLVIPATAYLSAMVVKAVADAVRSIIGIYKDVVEVRGMKSKLRKVGADGSSKDDAIGALELHVRQTIDDGIDEAADRIFSEHSKIEDENRANEVRNHIRANMKRIAARIDRGFNFETRMGALPPLEKKKDGEEGERSAEDVEAMEMRDSYEKIEEAHREQVTLVREGEPILSLPEPEHDDNEE